VHTNPHYRIPTSALGGHGIGGVQVGNARAALEVSIEMVEGAQHQLLRGENARLPDGAAAHRRRGRQDRRGGAALAGRRARGPAHYEEGKTLDTETKLRFKRNSALANKLCVEAVTRSTRWPGAHGIYDKYPLQRMFRDAHAAAGHFSFSTDAQYTPGRTTSLGGEFTSPTL
jgi:3-hydroxy-9,10-secoandrosta-1,3,5(10)-triene-9,17-dione monooxygenase